jgi:hypothetical protein
MQAPCAWFGSHLLFAQGTTVEGVNLYRVPIGTAFRIAGPPEPLTSGLGITHLASVSRDGLVVLPRWTGLPQLWSLDPEVPGPAKPQQLTRDAAGKMLFSLDRAGSRVAYTAMSGRADQQGLELRVRDLGSGEETTAARLSSYAISQRPRLSPDGAVLAWETFDAGKRVVVATRTGEPGGQDVCRECRILGFASDGRVLLSAGPRVFLRAVAGGPEATLLEADGGTLLDADLSWDDRWLATLAGNPDGTFAIRVDPVGKGAPAGTRGVEVARSEERLTSPRWSPDGDRLYSMAVHDGFLCIFAQALDPVSKAPRGAPAAVFHAHGNPWRMVAPRALYAIAVARRRLVFGAVDMTGNILMAKLPPE